MGCIRLISRCPPARRCLCGLLLSLPVLVHANEQDFFDYSLGELLQENVTAQKREQDAQDVPLSVATLQGDNLDALGSSGMDVRQLSLRVPSLLIESSFGRTFPRFYLRGMGNPDFDLLASQPVSLSMDEVMLESPLLKGYPLYDLDRVEVLRGPQGTLFGRNTPAGIVKLESRKPGTERDAWASIGYGSHGSINIEGAADVPLAPKVSMRVSLLRRTREDWIDNDAPAPGGGNDALGGYEDTAARAQLRIRPNEALDVLLNYHVLDAEANSRVFMANAVEKGGNELADDLDYDTVYQDAAARNEQTQRLHGVNARVSWDTGRHTLFYVGGFETADVDSRGDIDGGYGACFLVERSDGADPCQPALYGNYERASAMGPGYIPFAVETAASMPQHHQLSHELRLASNELGAFDYQLGLFWLDEDLEIRDSSYDSLAGGVRTGLSEQQMRTESWAVFASGDYALTERIDAVAGLRWSHDRRDWHGELVPAPGTAPFAAAADVDDGQLSWDLSAMYALDAGRKLYARVAKGYRAPSIQGRNLLFAGAPTTADAETLLSFEVGFKAVLLDQRARLNAALFHYEAEGQQLTAVGGGSNVARLLNAKRTIGHGAELDSELVLSPSFRVWAGFSYNNTELQDRGLAVSTCGADCTVTDRLDADGRALIDGNSLPYSPRWIANISARYARALGPGEVFVYTDWAWRSEVNFLLYESEEFMGDALLEGGLRAGYGWDRGDYHFEWAVFGRNILDETALEGSIDFNNRTGYLNEPRYFGLEFSTRFR